MVVGSRKLQQPALPPAVLHAQLAELRQQHAELLQRAAELLHTNVRQEQVLLDNGLTPMATLPSGAKQTPALPRPPKFKPTSRVTGGLHATLAARICASTKRPFCDMQDNEQEQDGVPDDDYVRSDEDEVPDAAEVCSL